MKPPFYAASVFLLMGAAALAQTAASPGVTPWPGTIPAPAGSKGDDLVPLQFPSNPVGDILAIYETLSGKTLIRDANLAGGASLTIVSKPIPKAEALRVIESALLLNGYSLVPGADNTVKVIGFGGSGSAPAGAASGGGGGKGPRSEGIPLYTTLADLPLGDQLASYYMPLRYTSPADAATLIAASIPPHSFGAMVPVPNAQCLVITESATTIRQMARLKDLIDVPPTHLLNKWVQLERADAEKVAGSLTALLGDQKKGASGQGSAGGAPAGPQSEKLVSGDVQITPEVRTNRILVVCRPESLDYIVGLIEEYDRSANVVKPYTRHLNYVAASDMLPVLQNLLAESKDDASTAAATAASGTTSRPPQANRTAATSTSYNGSSGTTGGGSDDSDLSLGDEPSDLPPQAIIVGKTRLIADNKTNAIMVIGPPESVARVDGILDQLDTHPRQVYLATVIGSLDVTNSSELSLDLLQNFSSVSGNVGVATSSMNSAGLTRPTVGPRSLTNPGAFPFLGGVTVYGALGNTLNYYLRALESSGRFTLMNRPSLAATNYKKAVISSGQKIPIPSSTLSSLDTSSLNNVAQQSNVEYQDVELKLSIIPLINANKEVTLQISQVNDSANGSTTISGNAIPNINTAGLLTTITVPNKHTIVLGGLIKDSDEVHRTGWPLLKDIPYLGAAFRSDTKTRERTEMVILIEPIVVESDEELAAASAAEAARSGIGGPSVQYATRPASVVKKGSSAVESLTH